MMHEETKRLLQENNALEEQLPPEDRAVLTDMVVYLRSANITTYRQECVRRDITEMLLEGRRRGDTVDDVIGGDYRAFCDAVLAEVTQRTAGERALEALGNGCLYGAVLLGLWLVLSLVECLVLPGNWPWLPVTAGNLVMWAVIMVVAVGLVEYVCKTAFDHRKNSGTAVLVLVLAAMAGGILAGVFLQQELFHLHFAAALGLLLVLLAAHRAIGRHVR